MLGNGVKQGAYTEQEAPGAEDIEQDVAPDALRKNGPAEFIDVEVAAGEVAVLSLNTQEIKINFKDKFPLSKKISLWRVGSQC
jgi:hypothetical protein